MFLITTIHVLTPGFSFFLFLSLSLSLSLSLPPSLSLSHTHTHTHKHTHTHTHTHTYIYIYIYIYICPKILISNRLWSENGILRFQDSSYLLSDLTIKANEMHYFSNWFDKLLYMFRKSPLPIIRSISTLYTQQ